jgi:hypothetical protein
LDYSPDFPLGLPLGGNMLTVIQRSDLSFSRVGSTSLTGPSEPGTGRTVMAVVESRASLPVIVPVGFFVIASLTWFFSAHRHLFIRTFVPKADLRTYVRSLPRGDDFRKGMRTIAVIQFIVAVLFAIAALWARI